MVAWQSALAVSMLCMAVFGAGCAEGPVDPEVQGTDQGDSNETVNPDAPGPDGGAVAVVPAVTVLVAGNATESLNGTFEVPADTNVTFDASNSTGAVAYAWSIDDRTLNGSVVAMSFAPGNHSVLLEVTGDANQTANLTLSIAAVRAAPDVLGPAGSTTISFSKGATTFVNGACNTGTQELEFPEGTITQRVAMTLSPAWTGVAVSISFKVALQDASGAEVLVATRSGGNTALTLDEEGLSLPAGTYTALGQVCALFGPQVSFSVTGQADHFQ